jgi:hypothetical protein
MSASDDCGNDVRGAEEISTFAECNKELEGATEISASDDCGNDLEGAVDMSASDDSGNDVRGAVEISISAVGNNDPEGAVELSMPAVGDKDLNGAVDISASADCTRNNVLGGASDDCVNAVEGAVEISTSATGDKDLRGAVEISISAVGDKHVGGKAPMCIACSLVEFCREDPQGIVGPLGLHVACRAAACDSTVMMFLTIGAIVSAENNFWISPRPGFDVADDPVHLMIASGEADWSPSLGYVDAPSV